MDVHVTTSSEFHNEVPIEHRLNQVEIPIAIEINSHLDDSAVLQSSYSSILIPPLDRFCRVCGHEMEPKDLVPIFDKRGIQLDIPKKITTHLQIHVLQDDGLPQQVCFSCICQLNICQQLYQVSQEADIKLRNTFEAVKRNKGNSSEILTESAYQPIHHDILKNPSPDNLDLLSSSNNTFQEIKIVLMENDLHRSRKQENHPEEAQQTEGSLISEVKSCRQQNSSELLREHSIQSIEHQNLNNSQPDCENKMQEINLVLLENGSIKGSKTEIYGEAVTNQDEEAIKTTERNNDDSNPDKKKDLFLCDHCGKHFSQAANLRTHKRTHLADSLKKKHQCSLCSKSFRSKFFLSEHMNMHKGIRPYGCSDCEKIFHRRTQLRQHRKTHISDNQKVECEICGLKFSRRGNLMQHIKRHNENRKYVCRICKEEFNTLSSMLSHRRIHTQEDIKKRIIQGESKEGNIYTCETCGKVLFKKSSFAYHLRTHKEQSELEHEKLKCNLCGKLLASKASLNYHTRSQHSSERPWRCQFCAEGFMLKDLLLTHERIHTGEKPFLCSVCNKAFRAPSNLSQHMLMHSEKRNFQCPYCNKCFHRKGTLIVHIRTHTGERPFICDLCGRPFTQKNDMLKHQRTHGLQPQYSCEVCSLSFNFKKDLSKHKLLNHREELETEAVPVIFTTDNNVFANITHIITEDGKKILLSTVQSFQENNNVN